MEKHYPIAEVQQGLPAIVQEVERGGRACITRRGYAVAYLISASEFELMQSRRKEPDWNLFSLDLRDFKFDRGEANSRWASNLMRESPHALVCSIIIRREADHVRP